MLPSDQKVTDDASRSDERAPASDQLTPVADDFLTRLVKTGKLTQRQFRRTLDWQKKNGGDAQLAVQNLGLLSKEDMLKALSQRFSYPIFEDMPDRSRFSRELVAGHEPFGLAAEAIRSIRSTIAATALANGTRSFVVIGPQEKVGVTYLACNLAVSFAQMSIPTLLVDANLRNPRMNTVFGFEHGAAGLSDLLTSRGHMQPPIQVNVLPKLSILPAGSVPPNPQELLSSPEFLALTDAFHDQFGVVIYDTPSTAEFSDAFVVASRISAAIVVARRHKTTYRAMTDLVKKLESIRCGVVGTVFNQH